MAEAEENIIDDDEQGDKVEEVTSTLTSVLPEVDPDFLHTKAAQLVNAGPNAVDQWVEKSLRRKCAGLPTRAEYDERVKVTFFKSSVEA